MSSFPDQLRADNTWERYRDSLAKHIHTYHHVYLKRHLLDVGHESNTFEDDIDEGTKGNVKYLEISDANRILGPDIYLKNERALRKIVHGLNAPNKEGIHIVSGGKKDESRNVDALKGNVKYLEITDANRLLGPETYSKNGEETLKKLLSTFKPTQLLPDKTGTPDKLVGRNVPEHSNIASVVKDRDQNPEYINNMDIIKDSTPVFKPLKEDGDGEQFENVPEVAKESNVLDSPTYHYSGVNVEEFLHRVNIETTLPDTAIRSDRISGKNARASEDSFTVVRKKVKPRFLEALKGNVKYLEITNANQMLGPETYLKNGETLEELLQRLRPNQTDLDGGFGKVARHLLNQNMVGKSNDHSWYAFLKSLVKSSNQQRQDVYFFSWHKIPQLLPNQTRTFYVKQFPALPLKEAINGLGKTDAFLKLFWPFNYDFVTKNQKIALFGITGKEDEVNVKTRLFKTLYDIYALPIPVAENKIITSFNDHSLALMLNRSGVLNESVEYMEQGLYKYNEVEKATVESNIRAAMHLINETAPELYSSITQLIACIAVYKETQAGYIGASSSALPGLIYLNAPTPENDWPVPYYAEQIVHEYIHNVLYLQEFIRGTYENHSALSHAKVISCIRRQLRNYDLGFHAAYVSTGLVAFTSRAGYRMRAELLAGPLESSIRALVDVNKEYGVLTIHGEAMLQALVDFTTLARFGI